MLVSVASAKLVDIIQPQPVGEPVNAHVVTPPQEPKLDFEAMKRLIEGSRKPVVIPPPSESQSAETAV